jgi:hypothetical protein
LRAHYLQLQPFSKAFLAGLDRKELLDLHLPRKRITKLPFVVSGMRKGFFRNLLVIFNWLVWLMCEKWRRAFKEWGPGNDDVAKRG